MRFFEKLVVANFFWATLYSLNRVMEGTEPRDSKGEGDNKIGEREGNAIWIGLYGGQELEFLSRLTPSYRGMRLVPRFDIPLIELSYT